MRILILGGDGMLGHQLLKHFASTHEVRVTVRQELQTYAPFRLFNLANTFDRVDVRSFEGVSAVLTRFRPDAIVNAVGIVKQRAEAKAAIPSLEINSLFPHRLALLCREKAIRLVHMSTDCVFSGRAGNYKETDIADAEDLYGRSKLLGEVCDAPCVTLRTSMIGRELSRKTSLLEWFLAQRNSIKGFRQAIFSGFTTIEMARILDHLLTSFPNASGLYHVSSAAISKYDLLNLVRTRLKLDIKIVPDEQFTCNLSLDSTHFRNDFSYTPPTWESMVDEFAESLPA